MKILNWPAIQNPRPPKKWWDLWVKRMKKQYPRLGKVRIAEIVGRIWSNIHPKTKLKLRVYYATQKRNPLISEVGSTHAGLPNPPFGQFYRWYYKLPGQSYAYGPTTETYSSKRAARAGITKAWGRLPRGTELWPDGSAKLNPRITKKEVDRLKKYVNDFIGGSEKIFLMSNLDYLSENGELDNINLTTAGYRAIRQLQKELASYEKSHAKNPADTVKYSGDLKYSGKIPLQEILKIHGMRSLKSNPKNLRYNWRQVPTGKEGGKRFFYVADTPDGVRKVIWNRNSRKWTVYGEQAAPGGEAPVYGRFNSPIEAMEFVEGKTNPLMRNPGIPKDWWNATYKEVAMNSPGLDEKALSAITASIWWDKLAQARVNAVIRARRK